MGGLQITLTVLALAASVKGQAGPPCWYDSMCPHTEQDTSLPIPASETDLAARMDWCYDACVAAETDTPDTCKYFTVFTNRGGSLCKLLTSCKDADADAECLALGTCNSGPGDCDAPSTTVCNVLSAPVDPAIPWQCDTVNPYSTPVPDGETCFLSCDGWVNRANGVQAVILSTCENGIWEAPALSEGDQADYPALPQLPATLPAPDADAEQLSCGCADEPMAWDHDGDDQTPGIVYDPNTLPGTTFLCTEDYLTGEFPAFEFKITPSMVCRLFCDGYHVATMSCQDGSWTGEPELGAWCYAAPTAADDVNA